MPMQLTPTTPLRIPEHVLMQELDGESVLLDLKREAYFGLDDVGTRIWTAVARAGTISDACRDLLREYAVQPEPLMNDVTTLVQQLVEQGLIRINDEPRPPDISPTGL